MGFTVDAKHVILCGILTLFLTWAAFHDKFPHGDSVSVQGRKDLSGVSLTDTTPVLGDASDATEGNPHCPCLPYVVALVLQLSTQQTIPGHIFQ